MDHWTLLNIMGAKKPPIIDGYVISPEHKLLVSISGGKDSLVAWALCENEFKNEVVPVFCNTGHESDQTYDYLRYLQKRMKSRLRVLERKIQDMSKNDWQEVDLEDCSLTVMEKLGVKKKRFPGSMSRFCTTILKLEPLKWWLREQTDHNKHVMITGLRAEESPSRAKADPYLDFDEYYKIPRWHIIFHWTRQMVFAAHRHWGIKPNVLYTQGFSRVGCFPCVFSRKDEIRLISQLYPEAIDKVRGYERAAGRTFFPPGKTPDRFCSQIDPKSGKPYPTVDDVVRWANGEEPEPAPDPGELEDLEAPVCTSQYGLCG